MQEMSEKLIKFLVHNICILTTITYFCFALSSSTCHFEFHHCYCRLVANVGQRVSYWLEDHRPSQAIHTMTVLCEDQVHKTAVRINAF